MTEEKPKKKCRIGHCDYKNAVRYGRADWRCPKCGRDITLMLVFIEEAKQK